MKPAGEAVTITYDSPRQVVAGDVIKTTTGRRYLVNRAKRRAGRKPVWVLGCVVMAPTDPNPVGAVIHPLVWVPRG